MFNKRCKDEEHLYGFIQIDLTKGESVTLVCKKCNNETLSVKNVNCDKSIIIENGKYRLVNKE